MIHQLADAAAAEALAERLAAQSRLRPFAADTLAFTAALSQAILADPRSRPLPEVVALGYWLRPASMHALAQHFSSLDAAAAIRVPVGLALHIPPANVDPIFAYSWLLALVCGNCGIVRLPRRRGPVAELLLDQIERTLRDHAAIAATTAFVEYGHDDAITAALSERAGLRVIWGGDHTIRHIRALPLSPRGKDVVFADRKSCAALSAPAFLALDDKAAAELMDRFALDVFLFNQMACSSVRLLAWCGPDADTRAAAARALPLLRRAAARRGFQVDAATALAKYAACQRLAMDRTVAHIDWGDGLLAVVELEPGAQTPWPEGPPVGGGLLVQTRLGALADMEAAIDPHVQTLAQFGFAAGELESFVRALNGRGIDRIVPLGSAMAFAALWDGYDLVAEFTRVVAIG